MTIHKSTCYSIKLTLHKHNQDSKFIKALGAMAVLMLVCVAS